MKQNVVCLFNTNESWGGGEKWHFEAGKYFTQKGLKVFFITQVGSKLTEIVKQSGMNAIEINCSRLSYLNPWKIHKIKKILSEQNTQTVISNLPQDFKLAGLAAQKAGVKNIIYRRGMPHPIKDKSINRQLFLQVYTHVIVNSREVEKSLLQNTSQWFPKNKIVLVYNGINTKQLSKSNDSFIRKTDDLLVLGNAGRLVEQKGQSFLIELAKNLKSKGVNFKLLIAGVGPLEQELKAQATASDVHQQIEFLGQVTDMPKFFNSIDILIFPSLFEGMANTLIEAMGHEKPCVGFNLSSIPEVIRDEVNGYLIEPFNIEQMADQVIELWNDKQRLKTFANNAYQTVVENFDYQQNMDKLLQMLQ